LAALGEACCLVLRQGVTPLQDIRRALDDVEHLRVLGVVLNQVRVATPRWLLRLVPQE
jgi:Mrp family chromosome partitioning ATPase